MALPNIWFDPPYDIHLLRGQSIDLIDLLKIGTDSATTYMNNNASVSCSFDPMFFNIPVGNIKRGFNIDVDTTTGRIEADAAPPAPPTPEKRNFLVIVEARDSNNNETKTTSIRVNIHQSIQSVMLSPDKLTVQRGIDGFQFSLRARFDDDVVAEIGRIYKYKNELANYTFNPQYNIAWSSPTANLINANTGEITPDPALALQEYDISVEVQILGNTHIAAGKVIASDKLDGTNLNIKAELVATGNCPGFAKIDEVPNILFVPDGFDENDEDHFNKLVDKYVSDLSNGKITSPFNILAGSINYWKVFIPSREKGANHRCEIYFKQKDNEMVGRQMFDAEKPDDMDTSKWYFTHLYYYIGFPVKWHKNRNYSQLKDEWKATTTLSDAQVDAITNDAIDNWKRTGERRLPEERDTILGIRINDSTSSSKDDRYDSVHFYEKRMDREKFDEFLFTLQDDQGNAIGDKFIKQMANRGKDWDNIAFLSAALNGRENNFQGGFFLITNTRDWFYKIDGQFNNIKASLIFPNDKEELTLSAKATITHELGHSFALEDEYGEDPPNEAYSNKFIDHQDVSGWEYAKYTGAAFSMDWSGNVQARKDLLSPNPNIPNTGMIDAEKIKWRYHRIQKCGMVVSNPVKAGNQYTITLKNKNQAEQFAANDAVFLRKRNDDSPIAVVTRQPPAAQPNITSDTITRTVSQELEVVSVNPGAHQVVVKTADGSNLDANLMNIIPNVEVMILYNPVRAPDDVYSAAYKFAELIPKKILDHLKANPFPLNARKDNAGKYKEIIDGEPVQNSFLPSSLVPCCSSRKKEIVGLYSCGNQYHGHIYHPTGHCFMRSQLHGGSLDEFCAVCRYTLVDMIDPYKHGKVDELYENRKINPDK
ncbi:MAG: hypothetical protein JXB26_19310 [Candidatus Aminicenantes bacterium]|nr:hypothetical protein [Candidatus Aminicenantes bacterium]